MTDMTYYIWEMLCDIWDTRYEIWDRKYAMLSMKYETRNLIRNVSCEIEYTRYQMWVVRRGPRISDADMQRHIDMHILESFIWGFYIIAVYNLRPTNLGHANPQTRILQCWIVQCGILQNRIPRCGILQCGLYIVRYYKSQTAGQWIINPNPHLPVLHIWGSYNLGSINAGCFNVGSCDVGFYKIRATDLESVRRSFV